jgi:phage repressor protein C with HTH and peptisase S24 domain
MTSQELIHLILLRLKETGLSAAAASSRAVGNHYLIRNMQRRGGAPSFEALQSLCKVLGLEFYIGPPRDPESLPPKPARRQEKQDKLPSWVGQLRSRIRQDLHQALSHLSKPPDAEETHSARYVEVRELSAAAGSGAADLDETVSGYIPFSRQWLDRQGLFPDRCTVIGVRGESMEPSLPEGSSILVDRSPSRPKDGCIYVFRTPDGLVVKRACKDPGGGWWLLSDHPAWKPTRCTGDTVIIGEVRWVGKTL